MHTHTLTHTEYTHTYTIHTHSDRETLNRGKYTYTHTHIQSLTQILDCHTYTGAPYSNMNTVKMNEQNPRNEALLAHFFVL